MSAPCSIGRQRIGVGKVLSTMSGTPKSWAALANLAMSRTTPLGLATVSPKTHFVFGRNALAISSGVASGSTNVVSIPSFFSETAKRLKVAVDLGGGDDVVAGRAEVEDGEGRRGLSGAGEHRGDAAFERGDLLGDLVVRRVREARVEVAARLQVEEVGHLLARLVLVGRRGVDRDLAGLALLRLPAALDAERVDFHLSCSPFPVSPPSAVRVSAWPVPWRLSRG